MSATPARLILLAAETQQTRTRRVAVSVAWGLGRTRGLLWRCSGVESHCTLCPHVEHFKGPFSWAPVLTCHGCLQLQLGARAADALLCNGVASDGVPG
jgi:hypothetical protein